MLFTEPTFLVFFAAVFAVHWALRSNTTRKVLLLIASYLFYAAWDWRFISLIVASTLIDFGVGLALSQERPRCGRRFWLVLSICANLGILGFFKYFNFFLSSCVGLLELMGVSRGAEALEPALGLRIILPVGISFFTFQSMSYTIDVYRGNLKPVRSLLDFALFVGFFPQLVAGPIVRAADFLPQLKDRRTLRHTAFKEPIALFIIGFVKKACIADNLAPHIDRVFAAPGSFGALSIWIAVFFYAVQIYCDFSGYTDMAIAVARMFGYRFCPNFDSPYFARNIQEFWRRWHMSLSTWLRDYLYIPLGGSRGTEWLRCRNLIVTMLLGGLWHGASWHFVIWGGLHGVALIVCRLFGKLVPRESMTARVTQRCGVLLTFYWVCLAWVFFRCATLADAVVVLKGFVLLQSPGNERISAHLLWVAVALAAVHLLSRSRPIEKRLAHWPDWACACAYGVAVALILLFVPLEYKPFVYFQF